MQRVLLFSFRRVLVYCLLIAAISGSCKKTENPIKFPKGTFPDSVVVLEPLNTVYNDYNISEYCITGGINLVFSSDRSSSGSQFDLSQGKITFTHDQTNGDFTMTSAPTNDSFLSSLIAKANTTGDDFGPYRFFSSVDGFEYLILSSETGNGDLDFRFLMNRPSSGTILPLILGPYDATKLNSAADDAYFCFDSNQDTCFFSSSINGDFDIFLSSIPAETELQQWFGGNYASGSRVDSVCSDNNDKCPYVSRNIMVFASDRPGGLGGYDIYYSLYKEGKWSSPVNFGPGINSQGNDFRPVLGYNRDFLNFYLIFSSDRPGGKGGFDLYFTGIDRAVQE